MEDPISDFENLIFDRIYIYEKKRPIHISLGNLNNNFVYQMIKNKNGNLTPRLVKDDKFINKLG